MEPTANDGRYAPSPTGDLHIGNLRTALAAWLMARSHGASFAVRIDDLDPDRVRPGIAERQLEDLRALGIDWDGEPVVQSERRGRYDAALDALDALGLVYPCFCSRAEVRAAASAPHEGDGDSELRYPGTCRNIASADARRRIDAGEAHCLRLRADGAHHDYDDAVLGRVRAWVDDVVIRRRDGVPAYNLATVVDEHDMRIGQVVRGADLAATTVTQLWIANALDLRTPTFAHIALVLGPDGARLAKRHGAVGRRDLAELGVDDHALLAWLAVSLGLDTPAGTELRSARDLIASFTTAALPRTDAHFDGVQPAT